LSILQNIILKKSEKNFEKNFFDEKVSEIKIFPKKSFMEKNLRKNFLRTLLKLEKNETFLLLQWIKVEWRRYMDIYPKKTGSNAITFHTLNIATNNQ